MRPTRLPAAGLSVDAARRHAGAALRDAAGGLWALAGSRQLLNLLVVVITAALLIIAQQGLVIQRHLAVVAEAQQVSGYATMRYLRASGLAPAAQHAPPPAAQTIDPAQLDAPARAASDAPSHSAAAATTGGAPGAE